MFMSRLLLAYFNMTFVYPNNVTTWEIIEFVNVAKTGVMDKTLDAVLLLLF